MQYLNKAYLLIGGNVGNRLFYLQMAVTLLDDQCCKVINKSAIYETAPWGNTNQAAFLNQALEISTDYAAPELMLRLLNIEEQLGRKRIEKYGPRIIDLDILLFNDEIYSMPELIIPHAELQNRQFALKPLSDIAGQLIHPVLKKSIQQLLNECQDTLQVKEVEPAKVEPAIHIEKKIE